MRRSRTPWWPLTCLKAAGDDANMSDPMTTPRSDTLPPDAISDVLLPVVEELGLVRNCRQLAVEGWTVIENAADPEFVAHLRKRILKDGTNFMRLDKAPVYAEAALNPKVMAIAEFSVGRGFLLYGLTTTVRGEGAPAMHVHADQALVPAPFPEHNMTLVACWACDDCTQAGGGTLVVPGTGALRRHPREAEAADLSRAIAIECPAGSIIVWDGSIWHGNWPRTLAGERVLLHAVYTRLLMRPGESYAHVADELIATWGTRMSQLLGREDYLEEKDFDWVNDPRNLQTRINVKL